MKRPSRRFVWTLFALLLVAAGLLGLWVRLQPAPARTPAPDVWTRGGTVGDLRDAPDGRPLQGWVFVGSGGTPPVNPSRMPFIVIVPRGRETPSTLERLRGRITGD
ncbi:MAG TPA: hypothetical protein VFS92_00540, partial [Planctomycetota bacterium]|nr:hypothetical protein [Planctomycetota bacterium]